MKPLILFDFDGVLADSLSTFEGVVREALEMLGYNFIEGREDFLDLFRDNLYVSLSKKGVPPEEWLKVFDYVGGSVDFKSIKLFDGIKGVLKTVSPLANLAVISSNKESQINEVLQTNDAAGFFHAVLGYDAGVSKVEKFKMAIDEFRADAAHTYYILDTIGDIYEARKAGIKTIAVSWGWHEAGELKRHKPDYFVESCKELVALIIDVVRA